MAITHAVVKAPLQPVAALADWNAAHVGTLNHLTELTNVGVNTHAQIDTHIALVNEHIDWTNAAANFLTTGSLDCGKITSASAIRFDIAGTEQMFLQHNALVPTTTHLLHLGLSTLFGVDQFNDVGASNTSFGSTTYKLQSFTTGATVTEIKQADIYARYVAGVEDDIRIRIYLSDTGVNDNKPTGPVLGTATIPSFNDVNYAWREAVFASPVSVASSTKYVMVIDSAGSSATNTYMMLLSGANPYPGGVYGSSANSGSTWTVYALYDIWFRTRTIVTPTEVAFERVVTKYLELEADLTIPDGFKIKGGYLRIGDAGTPVYTTTDGDLFVERILEVGAGARFKGSAYIMTRSYVSADTDLVFGGTGDARIMWETAGNDYLWIGINVGSSGASGNIIINADEFGKDFGHAIHIDPHLYIQSGDTTNTLAFIQFWHDQTDANIEAGAGNLKVTTPGGLTATFGADTNTTFAGIVDAVGGFKDNGVAGVDGWFDDGAFFRVTVAGGIITVIGDSIAGGHS